MQIEAAFSLSEEYYKFMSDFAQTSFEDDKLLGKFYTDFTVAKRMVETIVENVKLDVFSRDIKLIDPFCGDGRLISETIIQLIQKDIIHGRKLYISLWDIDEVAVNVAKQNVEEICNAYQLLAVDGTLFKHHSLRGSFRITNRCVVSCSIPAYMRISILEDRKLREKRSFKLQNVHNAMNF